MSKSLRIAAWNANGLINHTQEIILFLEMNKIDILLISESHATVRTVVKIPYYTVYYANHPDGSAHAGSAIIIKTSLQHSLLQPYITNKIQSAVLKINALPRPLTIAALYSPPRYSISAEEYYDFLSTLGSHFIVAGDWNSKHTAWGSRLITPKGRNLLKAIQQHNSSFLSTGEPTYWPTDRNKIPDLLDFAVTKGISDINTRIESNFDLASDHSSITITLSTNIIWREPTPKLCSKNTNWDIFQEIINENISINLRIKENHEIEEAVQYLTNLLQDAARKATPAQNRTLPDNKNIPLHIKELVQEKRRARRRWQQTRNIQDKTQLNRLTHRLHQAIVESRNSAFKYYITNLSADDHSIWKATKKFKRPVVAAPPIRKPNNNWARTDEEKADLFADYLAQVFTPLPRSNDVDDSDIKECLDAPCQLSLPINAFTPADVRREIKQINSHKAPGHDLIVGEILKHLPRKALVLLTTIYNSMLRLCYFPVQWKHAQVIMIAKPGKPPNETTSYRPISLLPLMSKIFEKLLLNRIKDTLPIEDLIPAHQFGFRRKHSTIQQCHRIVNKILENLEQKKMCTATFLDIQQAFDKVWHEGILYKLKIHFPQQIYLLLKSYLSERYFQVKINQAVSKYSLIKSGVPQGSVLGPFLYLLYTADIPATSNTTIATFADDTAILSAHDDPVTASTNLQTHLNLLQNWLLKWRIKVNTNKSSQITFTNKRSSCPPVTINNTPIPIKKCVKYLGLHLDEKLTWKAHIKAKQQQLKLKSKQMNWLIGKNSQLTLENKLIIYKAILKPIWSYGVELWGCSKPSNIKILQTFQSKTLRAMVNAPWYVSNATIHEDLKVPLIKETINHHANKYRNRSTDHNNHLIAELHNQPPVTRRLKRQWPLDLVN